MVTATRLDGKLALVTGGAGFIGSHIVDACMGLGAEVRVVDDMSNGSLENLSHRGSKRFKLLKADIRSKPAMDRAMRRVDVLFHQAAKVSVPYSLVNPVLVNDVNSNGTAVVLEAARRRDVAKVVVASSSSVYGDTPQLPKTENMRLQPNSPYASSKVAAETMALAFGASYGMNATVLRYFSVYGPRQRGGSYAGVISVFMEAALKGHPIRIEGDGLQSRDFTYVQDVVNANLLALQSPRAEGKVYNIGTGKQVTILNLAKDIVDIAQSSSRIIHVETRKGDVRHSLADISAARSDLGYEPSVTIEDGLGRTIQWVTESAKK